MVSSWLRHGLLDQSPWNVLLSVSMPNQLMPVRRTVVPVLSTIRLPLVRRYPVPVPAALAGAVTVRTVAVATARRSAARAARRSFGDMGQGLRSGMRTGVVRALAPRPI